MVNITYFDGQFATLAHGSLRAQILKSLGDQRLFKKPLFKTFSELFKYLITMGDIDDYDFSTTDAGASHTQAMEAGQIR